MFEAWLRLYDRTLGAALRFRAATMAVSFVLLVATAYLFMIVPKGFLPSEDQGRFNINTEGAQGLGFQEMIRHQDASRRHCREGTEHFRLFEPGRLRRGRSRTESGEHQRRAEAAVGARAVGRSDHREAASAGLAGGGDPRVHGQSAAHQHQRAADPGAVSVHAAGHRHRRAVSRGADSRRKDAEDARAAGRQHRPADQQPADLDRHEPRQDFRARPHGQPGRDRHVQRVRHAADLSDLRAGQPVPGPAAASRRSSSAIRLRSLSSTSAPRAAA